jgi:hypothetical protein
LSSILDSEAEMQITTDDVLAVGSEINLEKKKPETDAES